MLCKCEESNGAAFVHSIYGQFPQIASSFARKFLEKIPYHIEIRRDDSLIDKMEYFPIIFYNSWNNFDQEKWANKLVDRLLKNDLDEIVFAKNFPAFPWLNDFIQYKNVPMRFMYGVKLGQNKRQFCLDLMFMTIKKEEIKNG